MSIIFQVALLLTTIGIGSFAIGMITGRCICEQILGREYMRLLRAERRARRLAEYMLERARRNRGASHG